MQAGYQKLCGEEALEYARFRHEDSDLVRGVRQQDLLREAKQQVGVSKLVEGPRQAASRSSASTRPPTPGSRTAARSCSLLKLAVFSVDQPIREVHFEGQITAATWTGRPSYVTASNATVKKLTRQFLGVEETEGPRGELLPKDRKKRKRGAGEQGDGGLEKAPGLGKDQADPGHPAGRRRPAAGLLPDGAREELAVHRPAALLQDRDAAAASATRATGWSSSAAWSASTTGMQGTTWKDPPILESKSEKTQDRQAHVRAALRRRPPAAGGLAHAKAVYWVSNTLLQTLTERQMLAIARSTRLP